MNPADVFRANIDYIMRHNLWLGERHPSEVLEEDTGTEPAELSRNGIRYHSARNPERETQRQIRGVLQKDTAHVILIGAGAGFIIEAFARENLKSLLLIEPDAGALSILLSHIELEKKGLPVFILHPAENDSLEEVLFFLQNRKASTIRIYRHRPAFNALPELYTPVDSLLVSLLEKRTINQATIIKFQSLWNRNILLNLRQLLNGSRLNSLISQLKDRDVIICGAGPSLAQSLTDLKKYRDHFTLFAADTAFLPLTAAGIMPDAVFASDPQWLNHYFCQSESAAAPLWVLDPVVTPGIPHFLEAQGIDPARIFFWNNPFKLDEEIRAVDGSRGEVAHGGSVSTNAFDIARQGRAARIILTGQDLSFSDSTAHVKGAALESMVFYRSNRFRSFENHNYGQMSALPPVEVSAVGERKSVFTNAKLKVFLDWFASQGAKTDHSIRLYNTTAAGAHIENFSEKSFEELFNAPRAQPFDPLKAETDINKHRRREAVLEFLKKLRKELNRLSELYTANMHYAEQLESAGHRPGLKNDLLLKLDKNDKELQKLKQAGEIAGLEAQQIVLSITESGDEITSTEFYRTMKRAAANQLVYIRKALSALEN